MASDNLSPVGIAFPSWFVLSAMNAAVDRGEGTKRKVDSGIGGF